MRGLAVYRALRSTALQARGISTRSCLLDEEPAKSEDKLTESVPAKAPYIKKKKKLAKLGLDDSTFGELQRVHSTRSEIDQWLDHPTFFSMISDDAITDETEEKPRKRPPGRGPILTWETCVVFPSDGTSWHPLNRKVKMTVYVRDLSLDPMQKRRLMDLVQKRYKPETDELTITCAKFEQREDNRKEALRILYALLEEATNPVAAALAKSPPPAELLSSEDAAASEVPA